MANSIQNELLINDMGGLTRIRRRLGEYAAELGNYLNAAEDENRKHSRLITSPK